MTTELSWKFSMISIRILVASLNIQQFRWLLSSSRIRWQQNSCEFRTGFYQNSSRNRWTRNSFEILQVFWLEPCPFTSPKMFCAGPNFLSQPKNLTAFSASSKTFGPAQKPILLNSNHLFVWHNMFVTATTCKKIVGLAQKIWTSTKHFGTCKRTRH